MILTGVCTFIWTQNLPVAESPVHPNENTATVGMRANDLMQLIREKGNDAEFVEI